MATGFIDSDSFDNWGTTADAILGKYTSVFINNSPVITKGTTNGRFGLGGLEISCNSNNFNEGGAMQRILSANYGTVILGIAFKINAWPNFSTGSVFGPSLFEWWDNGTPQIALQYNPGGTQWQVNRGMSSIQGIAAGTSLGTAAITISPTTWHWISIKIVFAGGSSGSFKMNIDGSSVFNLTSINTSNSGNSRFNEFCFGAWGHGSDFTFDDWMMFDGTGTPPYNDVLADRRIDVLYPSSDSTITWTPNVAGTNFSRVNEHFSPDYDSTYVSDVNSGDIDFYGHDTSPINTGNIDLIKVESYSEKDNAGARSLQHVIRSNSIVVSGAVQALTTNYLYYADKFETDPNTGTAWTKAGLDASFVGLKNV